MLRTARWLLLIAFLIAVGLTPAALAPVTLALAGATTVLAAIPGTVWVAAAVIAWLYRKPTPAAPAKTARA